MQIMIDISEKEYNFFKNTSFIEDGKILLHQSTGDRESTMSLFRLIDAIKNGTPLPKGHGVLIERNKVFNALHTLSVNKALKTICDIPVIIEADEEVD